MKKVNLFVTEKFIGKRELEDVLMSAFQMVIIFYKHELTRENRSDSIKTYPHGVCFNCFREEFIHDY